MVEPIRWAHGPTGFADSSKARTVHATNWSQSGKPQTPAELAEALQGKQVAALVQAAAVLKVMGRDDVASQLIGIVAAELADDAPAQAINNAGGLRLDL